MILLASHPRWENQPSQFSRSFVNRGAFRDHGVPMKRDSALPAFLDSLFPLVFRVKIFGLSNSPFNLESVVLGTLPTILHSDLSPENIHSFFRFKQPETFIWLDISSFPWPGPCTTSVLWKFIPSSGRVLPFPSPHPSGSCATLPFLSLSSGWFDQHEGWSNEKPGHSRSQDPQFIVALASQKTTLVDSLQSQTDATPAFRTSIFLVPQAAHNTTSVDGQCLLLWMAPP